MTPTSLRTLLGLAAVTAALGWVLAALAYGDLPALPRYAGVPLVVLAVGEAAIAKVVRDRVRRRRDAAGRPRGRALHPLQVARAAVLAKSSSPVGAVVAGFYAGLLGWILPRRGQAPSYDADALAAGLTAAAGMLLVAAALALERACRIPTAPDDPTDAEPEALP